MRHSILLLAIALMPLTASSAPSPAAKPKPVDACSGLAERRLELSRELEALEVSLTEKNAKLVEVSKSDALVDTMTIDGEEGVMIDLTEEGEAVRDEKAARLADVKTLQAEISKLEPKRDELTRRLSRVRSTILQSCPAATATPEP